MLRCTFMLLILLRDDGQHRVHIFILENGDIFSYLKGLTLLS